MLNIAYSEIPSGTLKHERFEIPRVKSSIIGRRRGPTILYNYTEICDVLNRKPMHILKFLSKEMATSGTIDNSRVIFKGKFDKNTFEGLLNRYVNDFVICPVCNRPDTKIIREKRLQFRKCDACGAKSPVKSI